MGTRVPEAAGAGPGSGGSTCTSRVSVTDGDEEGQVPARAGVSCSPVTLTVGGGGRGGLGRALPHSADSIKDQRQRDLFPRYFPRGPCLSAPAQPTRTPIRPLVSTPAAARLRSVPMAPWHTALSLMRESQGLCRGPPSVRRGLRLAQGQAGPRGCQAGAGSAVRCQRHGHPLLPHLTEGASANRLIWLQPQALSPGELGHRSHSGQCCAWPGAQVSVSPSPCPRAWGPPRRWQYLCAPACAP